MKKTLPGIAFMIILSLSTMQISFAEAEAVSVDATEPVTELAALSIAAVEHGAEPEPTAIPIHEEPLQLQDAANTQEVLSGELLETTENPENSAVSEPEVLTVPIEAEATSTQTVPETVEPAVLGEATSTEETTPEEEAIEEVTIPGPASLHVVDADIVAEDPIAPDIVDELPVVEPQPVVPIAEIPIEPEIAPFTFELTGKQIPTRQQLLTIEGEVIDERLIDEAPELSIDDETGGMHISGVCGDAYYVILLYKEADDYARDPRSYILNRAYECTGAYSYSLDDLPQSLPNGRYYLLVGEQGSHGAWLPITSLVEVTINRE